MKRLALLAVLALIFVSAGCIEVFQPATTTVYPSTYVATSGPTLEGLSSGQEGVEHPFVNLRQLFDEWELLFPDNEVNCLAGGGTFHWGNNWVGCEGFGPDNAATCFLPSVQFAEDQCLAVGGEWNCHTNPSGDAYCRLWYQ